MDQKALALGKKKDEMKHKKSFVVNTDKEAERKVVSLLYSFIKRHSKREMYVCGLMRKAMKVFS